MDLPIISNSACRQKLKVPESKLPASSLCAGTEEGGKDTCYGDGGGPLSCFDQARNRWVLAGVTSWGEGCGEPDKPGVYMAVSYQLDFIQNGIVEALTEIRM